MTFDYPWMWFVLRSVDWIHEYLVEKCKEMDDGKAACARWLTDSPPSRYGVNWQLDLKQVNIEKFIITKGLTKDPKENSGNVAKVTITMGLLEKTCMKYRLVFVDWRTTRMPKINPTSRHGFLFVTSDISTTSYSCFFGGGWWFILPRNLYQRDVQLLIYLKYVNQRP